MMTKLQELIEQLCPNGVEYKSFGELATIVRGASPRPIKKYITSESNGVNWIKIGDVKPGAKFITETAEKITPEGAQKSRHVEVGDFILSNSMSFGRPYILKIEGCIHDGWLAITEFSESFEPDFLYYLLSSNLMQEKMKKGASSGGTVQNLNTDAVKALSLPIPPKEVQCEIVRLLDCFSERTSKLVQELSSELLSRKKQYEYYKNRILEFSSVVPVLRLGEITNVFSAARVHKDDWMPEGVPFFRSSDVVAAYNGQNNSRGKAFISEKLYEELSAKSGKVQQGDILVTGGGTIGIPYMVPNNDPLYFKDADLICIQKSDKVSSRFLYHYFSSTQFRDYLKSITHDATIAHYTISQAENTPIPVPDIDVQNRIVEVLDNFDIVCNSLAINLPVEIDAREKQYEYYRDLLLTFADSSQTVNVERERERERESRGTARG